jgi:hypothetical protein
MAKSIKMQMGAAKQAKGKTPSSGVKPVNPGGMLKKSQKPQKLQMSKMPNKAGL